VDYVKRLAGHKICQGRSCLINAGLSEEACAFFEGLADFIGESLYRIDRPKQASTFLCSIAIKKIP